jgi:predicted ArsR family transcriptional regulator
MTNEDAEAAPAEFADHDRKLTDARTLRALAHPVRMSLIEELALRGPMTATEVAELIGESPTTCSFHLRQLAKYDFVEEAGGGKGRARPWKLKSLGLSFSEVDLDGEAQLATGVVTRMFRERAMQRYQNWQETRQSYPADWRRAADETQALVYLTADELTEVTRELRAVLMPRFGDRLTDPSLRPKGALPIEVLMISYPLETPEKEG